jgi:hypothetical protein
LPTITVSILDFTLVIFSTLDLVFYPKDGGSTLLRNSGTSPQIYTSSCCCLRHYLCFRCMFVCSYKLMAKQTTSIQSRSYCMLHVQSSVLLALNTLHITSTDLHPLLLIRFLVHRALCVSHVTFPPSSVALTSSQTNVILTRQWKLSREIYFCNDTAVLL